MIFGGVRRSIRRKFMLVVMATTLVALLLASIALVTYDLLTYKRTWVADLSTQADILGLASAPALSFQDPKGTEIELFREWSYLGNHEQVVGVGALKLGHVAFVTPEPKTLAEFYGKVLGFRVSDWIGDFFVFMRCNADHHAVNFISGKNVKMHHIAFELRDFSHLQTACDLFGERKIPIIWGPVRLGPGHNVAAFHRDHDDWVVEFYTELDQMKDEELGYFDPRPWHRDRPQRPKVWPADKVAFMWGPPPTPDFMRGRD